MLNLSSIFLRNFSFDFNKKIWNMLSMKSGSQRKKNQIDLFKNQVPGIFRKLTLFKSIHWVKDHNSSYLLNFSKTVRQMFPKFSGNVRQIIKFIQNFIPIDYAKNLATISFPKIGTLVQLKINIPKLWSNFFRKLSFKFHKI